MQHYPIDPVAGGYTGWFLGLCRKIAAKYSRSYSFFRSFSRKRVDFHYIKLWKVFVRRWQERINWHKWTWHTDGSFIDMYPQFRLYRIGGHINPNPSLFPLTIYMRFTSRLLHFFQKKLNFLIYFSFLRRYGCKCSFSCPMCKLKKTLISGWIYLKNHILVHWWSKKVQTFRMNLALSRK